MEGFDAGRTDGVTRLAGDLALLCRAAFTLLRDVCRPGRVRFYVVHDGCDMRPYTRDSGNGPPGEASR